MYGKRRNSQYTSFLYFFYTHWDIDDVYTQREVADQFNIEMHLARYYLMQLVRERKICRIKHGRRSYFAHIWTAEIFKKFDGVKVITK